MTRVDEALHLLSEIGEELELSIEKAANVLTLRHAMTAHKHQSRTFLVTCEFVLGKSLVTLTHT